MRVISCGIGNGYRVRAGRHLGKAKEATSGDRILPIAEGRHSHQEVHEDEDIT